VLGMIAFRNRKTQVGEDANAEPSGGAL